MKKLVLIALFAALCLNFSNAYDRYSNESLIMIPDGHHKYKKRRYRDRCDDVVIYMDRPYGRYKQSDRGRNYRDKLIDQYIKNNNIKKGSSSKSGDRSYERGYDDGYDDGYCDRRYDYYYSPRPQIGIRVR